MKNNRNANSFGRGVVLRLYNRPKTLATVAIAATLAALISMTSIVIDENPNNIQNVSQRHLLCDEISRRFGSEADAVILLVTGKGILGDEQKRELKRVTEKIAEIKGVASVESLFDPGFELLTKATSWMALSMPDRLSEPQGQQELDAPFFGKGLLLDNEGRRLIIVIRPTREASLSDLLEQLSNIEEEVQKRLDVDIKATGLNVIQQQSITLVHNETTAITVLATIVSVVFCFLVFRRIDLTLVVGLTAATGLVWTLGLISAVGLRLNVLTTVMPVLVLVIGFTGAVHFVCELKAEHQKGMTVWDAAVRSMAIVGPACWYSALTTSIGFLSLTLTSNPVIREFGCCCALGAGLTFVALIVCGPLFARLLIHAKGILPAPKRDSRMNVMANRMVQFILRFHRPISVAGAIIAIGFTALTSSLRPTNNVVEMLPSQAESRQAIAEIDQHFAGSQEVDVLVDWTSAHSQATGQSLTEREQMQLLAEVEATCERIPEFRHPISYETFTRMLPPTLLGLLPADVVRRYYLPKEKMAVVRLRHRDIGSRQLRDASRRLEEGLQQIETRWPNLRLSVTGAALASAESLDRVTGELVASIAFAFLIIAVVVAYAFRSLRLAAIAILPNLLPLLAPAFLVVLFDEGLRLTSIITFSIFLGIAVDDTIHFIRRFERELVKHADVETAIVIAFSKVGQALVITSLVIIAGFASVAVGRLPHNQMFAVLACTAMLTALAADLILLPSLLAWLYRRPLTEPSSTQIQGVKSF